MAAVELLLALRRGTHGKWDDVRAFSTKSLTIRTSRSRAVNLNGKLRTRTPVKFCIWENALRFFVP